MATAIELHHVGEVVLAGLLLELAGRNQLDISCVLHQDCQLSTLLSKDIVGAPITFSPNVQLAPIIMNNKKRQFDGAHGIDVLCVGSLRRGLAIEAKLGLTRLASSVFASRFFKVPSLTSHNPQRIKGGMVAIMNYRRLDTGEALPLQITTSPEIEIILPWLLVIRRSVWKSWTRVRSQVPSFAAGSHVAIFEDIVQKHGDGQAFDALVHRLVGDDFFLSWGIDSRT